MSLPPLETERNVCVFTVLVPKLVAEAASTSVSALLIQYSLQDTHLKTTGIRRPRPHCRENAAGNPDSASVKVGVNLRDVQFPRRIKRFCSVYVMSNGFPSAPELPGLNRSSRKDLEQAIGRTCLLYFMDWPSMGSAKVSAMTQMHTMARHDF